MTHTLHPFGTPGTWPLRLKKGAAAGLLGLCCAFGPLPLALAQPDTPASTHGFNIPPQALAGALIAFGQQSGKQVSVDPQLLKGVSSPGVNGDMSNDAALAYLLQGTGIAGAIRTVLWCFTACPVPMLAARRCWTVRSCWVSPKKTRSRAPR
ncbi:hypothetical protein IQK56_30565 [Pseudomonas sp. MAFF 301449]|uniref:Secretin/TonB short N-terminal domain-containing protein n=1 Tax=Pseudomonas cyclaminis TaxID=2781239 RepID=A0ABR9T307_9PSED|nr:STN domain-containing protein [Pseudomonas cyclaminis]MBE8594889.1 hypothetical protein [Pseudomonas cyclaminis]